MKKINYYKRKKELIKICQLWNKKEITGNNAMSKIWDLYKKENLKEWNKKVENLREVIIKTTQAKIWC
ncbi:MAG: hypothetical protein ACE5KT_00305 [Methanosarcinales archaeon]